MATSLAMSSTTRPGTGLVTGARTLATTSATSNRPEPRTATTRPRPSVPATLRPRPSVLATSTRTGAGPAGPRPATGARATAATSPTFTRPEPRPTSGERASATTPRYLPGKAMPRDKASRHAESIGDLNKEEMEPATSSPRPSAPATLKPRPSVTATSTRPETGPATSTRPGTGPATGARALAMATPTRPGPRSATTTTWPKQRTPATATRPTPRPTPRPMTPRPRPRPRPAARRPADRHPPGRDRGAKNYEAGTKKADHLQAQTEAREYQARTEGGKNYRGNAYYHRRCRCFVLILPTSIITVDGLLHTSS